MRRGEARFGYPHDTGWTRGKKKLSFYASLVDSKTLILCPKFQLRKVVHEEFQEGRWPHVEYQHHLASLRWILHRSLLLSSIPSHWFYCEKERAVEQAPVEKYRYVIHQVNVPTYFKYCIVHVGDVFPIIIRCEPRRYATFLGSLFQRTLSAVKE